jgi:hypothetical protein
MQRDQELHVQPGEGESTVVAEPAEPTSRLAEGIARGAAVVAGLTILSRILGLVRADLQRVVDAIVSAEGVVRSSTLISLATQVPYRILPLVRAAASGSVSGRS